MADEIELVGPTKNFEDLKRVDKNEVEYWMARELMSPLGYTQWRSFEDVVKRAMQSCLNSGQFVKNHFADASKMVEIGSSTIREIKDWKLDRYACYLIAQNGDSRKEGVSLVNLRLLMYIFRLEEK